jgi:2'-5' RNA ligase
MMKMFKRFREFIFEGKKTYDYACAMIYFDFPEMENLHKQIDEVDVFVDPKDPTFGLETEPHCTLLYGLHEEVKVDKIRELLKGHKFGKCEIVNASLFENEKFDVLKFDVKNEDLHRCNADLVKLPHTTDYPKYHPHMTVAYLKPGKGKKYTEMFEGKTYELSPSHAVYSHPSGSKDKLKINKA